MAREEPQAYLTSGQMAKASRVSEKALRATLQQIADLGLPLSLFQNPGTITP